MIWTCCAVLSVFAQPDGSGFGFYAPELTPCITAEERAAIQAKLTASIASLRAAGKLPSAQAQTLAVPPLFGWPIAAAPGQGDAGVHGISNYLDQNTNAASTLDYNCGSRTYDGHGGTDIFLWPYAWWKMDHDEVRVVAAAPGTILSKSNGNYDRNCAMGAATWNAVYVQHADGSVAWYGHLKNNTVTSNAVGAAVAEGDYLGIVGSSGSSSGPHLHFEVHNSSNRLVDPWQGACNARNTNSWWKVQRSYFDSALNKLSTHASPVVWPACPLQETPNATNVFNPGATIYFYTYYRSHQVGDVSQHLVQRADGTTYASWTSTNTTFYASSWWYWYYTPAAGSVRGTWTYRVTYGGTNSEHRFFMGSADASLALANAPAMAMLNSNLTLTLRITNRAAASATYLTVTNPLPAGVAFVSASAGGAYTNGEIRWSFTPLNANAATQLSLTVTLTNTAALGAITNTARVTTGTYDTNAANDTALLVIPVDHDGDGLPTALEAGGDVNTNGVPAYLDRAETFDLVAMGGGLSNRWNTVSGAVYQLQFTTSLLPPAVWSDYGGPVTAQSASISVTDTNPAGQRSFRVRLQQLP